MKDAGLLLRGPVVPLLCVVFISFEFSIRIAHVLAVLADNTYWHRTLSYFDSSNHRLKLGDLLSAF